MSTPETLEVKRRGRHRLIGAITLAVLAVVIIPMVLDSEPRKVSKDLPLTIPPKEGLPPLAPPAADAAKPASDAVKPAVTAEVPAAPAPVAATGDGKPAEKPAEKKADAVVAKVTEAATTEKSADKSSKATKVAEAKTPNKAEKAEQKVPAKLDKAAEKASDKAAEKAVEKSPGRAEGFVIQLGAFSEAEKVTALKAKMKAAKVPVFTEEVKTSGGSLTRLRAGPYKTREQADKALIQVKRAGVEGKIVPLS